MKKTYRFFDILKGVGIALIILFTTYAIAERGDFATLGFYRPDKVSFWRVNSSGDFIPGKNNTWSIGNASFKVKDLNIGSTANVNSLVATTADIDGGTIDGTTIGANTASTGKFTTLQATTHLLYLSKIVNCDTDTAVTVANSGALYTNAGATTTVVYTLPAAAEGLIYLFSSVATDTTLDMTITAGAGDKINGGSAAGSYAATATEEKRACTIAAVDATNWRVISEVGTWANQ